MFCACRVRAEILAIHYCRQRLRILQAIPTDTRSETDGWMDGWIDGWMHGWIDAWMDGRMHGWMGFEFLLFVEK